MQQNKKQPNPVESNYEQSRIGIVFGDDFEQGPISIRAEAHFNEKKAAEQYEFLKNTVGDNLDIDWSIVCFLKYTEGQKDALIESITKIKNRPRFEAFEVKIHSDNEYVYFSVKLVEDEEAKLQGGLEMLLENGLRDMIKQQDNYLTFEFDANYDFEQLVDAVGKGERIGAAFLKQLRSELNLFITKSFYQGIEKFVTETDKDLLESPPLAFLKHFKVLDLDLRFRSTAELPEVIKKQMIFGEEFQTLNQEELQLPIAKTKQVNQIMKAAADNGFIYITIVDVCAVKIESHTPKLSTLLTKYGRLLANLVGLGEFVPDV